MQVIQYPSMSSVEHLWSSYFKTPSVTNDYPLLCYIEDALFNHGVSEVAVLVFIDKGEVRGIMPISYEEKKDAWSYWPSYVFISIKVTIDLECWEHLPTMLPRPFFIHESSFKIKEQMPKNLPWVSYSPANVINLTPYLSCAEPFEEYLSDLEKKTRSKLRNCLNRNQDIKVLLTQEYDIEGGEDLRQNYIRYCMIKFDESEDLSYFKTQLEIFPRLFETAEKLGQLVTLQIRLDNELVALNYSILEGNCLYDYICYRETCSEEADRRALGILAILKNLEWCLTLPANELYYDLASEFSYKRQFIPMFSSTYKQVTLSLT